MAYVCSCCGKVEQSKRYYPNRYCQSCYNYFRTGGTINPKPQKGEIKYDNRGYVICHICGRAYKRLGSHIKESHKMTIEQYKKEYGLCNNAKTTEANYSVMMRNYAYENDMPQRLLITGKNTRIKKGEKDKRLGKEVRLQERLDRSKRYKRSEVNV